MIQVQLIHDARPECPYRENDPGAADAHDALALSAHTARMIQGQLMHMMLSP